MLTVSSVYFTTGTYTPTSGDASKALPALTTIYTPPTNRASRWIQPASENAMVWSGEDTPYSDGVFQDYWCNPFAQGKLASYSPGVCSSGRAPVKVTVLVDYNPMASMRQTGYESQCCPRYMKLHIALYWRTGTIANANLERNDERTGIWRTFL
jgi:hypothetical protein